MGDRVKCLMCERGFPLRGAHHYGTQSLGMIQDTICEKRRRTALIKQLINSKRIATKPPKSGYETREVQVAVFDQCGDGGESADILVLDPGDLDMIIAALRVYQPSLAPTRKPVSIQVE